MFVNCAAGGSKASPPGWMPEAKTVGGPAGGISTICPLPTVETKTLPFASTATCRGDNRELAIVVGVPFDATLTTLLVPNSATKRLRAESDASPKGTTNPVVKIVGAPPPGANFRIFPLFCSETNKLPTASNATPNGLLSPEAKVERTPAVYL